MIIITKINLKLNKTFFIHRQVFYICAIEPEEQNSNNQKYYVIVETLSDVWL